MAGLTADAPLTSTLVVGVAWPLLLLASVVVGPVWRWVNPFDTLARPLERLAGTASPADRPLPVWWASLPAVGWLVFLALPVSPHQPRAVAAALAYHSAFALAGCVLLGRRGWLLRAEVLGLVLSWAARTRGGRLVTWEPPPGTPVVLGVLVGGLLLEAYRMSALWPLLPRTPASPLYPVIGVLLAAAVGAVVVTATDRWGGRVTAPGSVTAALVPVSALLGVVVSLDEHHLAVAVQTLPRVVLDPFAQGWDPIGATGWGIVPRPFGDVGLMAAQVLLLLVGAVLGVRTARARGVGPRGAEPAAFTVGIVLLLGVLAVTAV